MHPLKAYIYPSYGVANLGKVAVEVTLQLYLFDFYTRILGLSPLLAGTAFAIAIFWDALSDIVISAALFSARKRNIPYSIILFCGSIVLAASTVALFSPFSESSETYLFLHLLITYVLLNTGMTLLDLPHTSLSAELSHRANERNKLLASRLGFGILGLAMGSALPGIFLAEKTDTAALVASRTQASWALALCVLITAALTTLFIRKRESETGNEAPKRIPSLQEVKSVFQNKPFAKILIAGIIAAIGRTVNAALALMYYRFVLKLSEASVTQIVLPIFTLSIVLSIPLWIYLSKSIGKQRPAYIAVSALGIMGIIAYPLLPEGLLWPVIGISILGGVLSSAVFLVDSMITDIIDVDEADTGERKESLYFAVWKSGQKVARAIAFVGVGIGLQVIGLDMEKESVSQAIEWGIILLFGIGVGLCFLVSGYYLYVAKVPLPVENGSD